ncbi:MAG: response regulator transcription factor [Chloroflexia bacterium]|nr:response regulator transcription factor [Chloroflexia bacterium]
MKRILLVDDETKIVRGLKPYFRQAGFEVLGAYDGREALRIARRDQPDLIVLDLMLPEIDGLEVARTLRQEGNFVPIIMLTARVEESDRLIGLELGADDYVSKPFSPRELVARVRAVLRRVEGPPPAREVVEAGPFAIDVAGYSAEQEGRPLDLTPTELQFLLALARHPGQALSREQLLEFAHGLDYVAEERTADAHIKNLRRKVESDPAKPRYIVTVLGIGYKLVV